MKKSKKTPVPDIHPEEIIRSLGYDLGRLRSKRRTSDLADQRRVVAAVLRKLGMVEWHIADVLNRNRSSVHAVLSTSYLVEEEIRQAIHKIEQSDYGKKEKEEL